jgi:hypothetical protein
MKRFVSSCYVRMTTRHQPSALILALMLIPLSFSCSSSRGTAGDSNSSPTNVAPPQEPQPATSVESAVPSPQLSTEEQLRVDALRLGQEFLEKHIVQCGDSFYWRVYRPVRGETLSYEAKDKLETDIKGKYYPPKELSKAETLNGQDPQPLEWSGYITIHFGAGRNLGDTWHDNSYVSVEVNHCKGKWYVNAATFASIKTRSPYGAAEPYGIPVNFQPNDPTQDRFVEIECDR